VEQSRSERTQEDLQSEIKSIADMLSKEEARYESELAKNQL